MKNNILRKALAMGLAAMLLAGCGGSDGGQTDAPDTTGTPDSAPAAEENTEGGGEDSAEANYLDSEPLRIATMPHQMGITLYYADKMGLFEQAGINVEMSMFVGGAAINEAIGAGELDGAISGLASVYALSNGLVKMVGEVDTAGTDCLMIRADSPIAAEKGNIEGKPEMYGSAEVLKGQDLICQVGQANQFYFTKYLSQFGLTENDINFVNMEDAAGAQAFMSGEGDMIGTKMPYMYEMLKDGGYIIAASVGDATDILIKDCVIFTPEILETRREEVKIFLSVIYDINEQFKADEALRAQTINDFFAENGKEVVDEQVAYEMEHCMLFTKETLCTDDYFMGDGMQSVADFYGTTGAIDPDRVDNVYKNYDSSLLSEVLGGEVKAFSK
ncbi:MAG: ABC transporter substrate-binding protein [Lachnospiraceae bacterium]